MYAIADKYDILKIWLNCDDYIIEKVKIFSLSHCFTYIQEPINSVQHFYYDKILEGYKRIDCLSNMKIRLSYYFKRQERIIEKCRLAHCLDIDKKRKLCNVIFTFKSVLTIAR